MPLRVVFIINLSLIIASNIVNAHVKLHQEIRVWALKSAPP